MYVLEGGPRTGQLVDELPSGYAPVGVDGQPTLIELFDGYAARRAVWAAA